MGKYASKVVEQAKAWLGKKESDGTHKAIIDIYNAHKPLARSYKVKYTDSWCATTVSAIAIKLGYTDIIPTECSCERMIELFKDAGIWRENENCTPAAGWIVFYDWDDKGSGDNKGWADHVGIVEKVVGDTITVIEGNYSNAVKRRELKVNGKYIRGYGVPKYDAEPAKAEKSLSEIAKEVIAGKWGTGATRKAKLEAAGYDPEKVQAKVNTLLKNENTAATACYKKYTGSSTQIDTVLKAVGVPAKYTGSWTKRLPVARANGMSDYTGKTKENIRLITLAKRGQLKKA